MQKLPKKCQHSTGDNKKNVSSERVKWPGAEQATDELHPAAKD